MGSAITTKPRLVSADDAPNRAGAERSHGARPIRVMPRWTRAVLSVVAIGVFFGSSTAVGIVLSILTRLRAPTPDRRARFTRRLNRTWAVFLGLVRDLGLIAWWPTPPPPSVRGPVLVVANHPTLLDVALALVSMPRLVCVVKGAWYRSWVLGPMLRATELIPGPGYDDDDGVELAPVVTRIEARLREGTPVLVFPEGTRSPPRGPRRFRRGAIRAAVRAGVPILPLVVHVDRPYLSKGAPLTRVPDDTARYALEWLAPIPTRGRDERALARELTDLYRRRLALGPPEERR